MKYDNCPICVSDDAPEGSDCPVCDMRQVVDGMRAAGTEFPDCMAVALLAVQLSFPETEFKASMVAEPVVQH